MSSESEVIINGEVINLQQDEWSLTAPRFGSEGQLQVVGWSGRYFTGKFYILKCGFCSSDQELFGDGFFRSTKANLLHGLRPCGCGRGVRWTEDQLYILCSREARELGYEFLGFIGEWKGFRTKIKMLCEKHGEWSGGNVDNLLSKKSGCQKCCNEKASVTRKKPDDIMITSFFESGAFHPDTKFWRSDNTNMFGCKAYWYMSCPECGETGESVGGSLRKGSRSCGCNTHRQKECYINLVKNEGGDVVCIKFGIARDSRRRARQQNSKSIYNITQMYVYSFLTVEDCKAAERECKRKLERGILGREEMPDGHSETTYESNLDLVIKIYEKYGGIKL